MLDQQDIIVQFKEELDQKDILIGDQENVIKETQDEYKATVMDLTREKQDSEKGFSSKTSTLADQIITLQNKMTEMQKENESLKSTFDQMDSENKQYLKQKEEAEVISRQILTENEKLKSHYEILKDHELNIIRDYEGKKVKEISFYEQKVTDIHSQYKDEI